MWLDARYSGKFWARVQEMMFVLGFDGPQNIILFTPKEDEAKRLIEATVRECVSKNNPPVYESGNYVIFGNGSILCSRVTRGIN